MTERRTRRHYYPLFLCLLITMLLFGIAAVAVGTLLLDWSTYAESSVQAMKYIQVEQTKPLKGHVKEAVEKVEGNDQRLYTVLLIVGIFSIIFGIITTLIGMDICYMLCVRDNDYSDRSHKKKEKTVIQ